MRLLGRTGRDPFGELALRFLRREQVDVSWGLMFIAISPDGQRTMFGSRGANAEVTAPAGDASYFLAGIHSIGRETPKMNP